MTEFVGEWGLSVLGLKKKRDKAAPEGCVVALDRVGDAEARFCNRVEADGGRLVMLSPVRAEVLSAVSIGEAFCSSSPPKGSRYSFVGEGINPRLT